MPGPYEMSPEALVPLIGTPRCPRLIDVRTDEDFAADPRLIPGATRCPHMLASGTSAETTVVICQKGLKLSHGAAASIRAAGHTAYALAGGWLGWLSLGDAPTRLAVEKGAGGRWVTGPLTGAPERLAAIWLVRRFADQGARLLCVPDSEIAEVADRFLATPIAPSPVAGFSATLCQLGLATPALAEIERSMMSGTRLKVLLDALSGLHASDNDLIEAALPVCDAVYAAGAAA